MFIIRQVYYQTIEKQDTLVIQTICPTEHRLLITIDRPALNAMALNPDSEKAAQAFREMRPASFQKN